MKLPGFFLAINFIAQRVAQKQPACSSNTGAYSNARQRLPEKILVDLTRHTGKQLMTQAPAGWSWNGRHVKVVDGSTASMPDTEANQKEYSQMSCQKPGVGFPILRFLTVFSLSVGTVPTERAKITTNRIIGKPRPGFCDEGCGYSF